MADFINPNAHCRHAVGAHWQKGWIMDGEISIGSAPCGMEFNPLVSFYPNAYENLPTEIEAAKFIANIKGGTYAGLVKEIRQRFQTAIDRSVPNEDAKKAVDSLKKKLGSVTLAGIQPMRGNKFTPQFTGLQKCGRI